VISSQGMIACALQCIATTSFTTCYYDISICDSKIQTSSVEKTSWCHN